jgi:hypothetical protein
MTVSDLIGAMAQEGKRKRESSKQAREDREALLLSKLQAESLQAHGHPLDTSKKALVEKNAKLITGWQLVAARSMLGWGQVELAEKAHVSVETIHLMESHAGEVVKSNVDFLVAVVNALKNAGVIFIEGGIQVAQVLAVDDSAAEMEPRRSAETLRRVPKNRIL